MAKRKPPHHVNVLHKWVGEHVRAEQKQEQGLVERRYQRWLSYMVVSAILDQVRDENDDPVFLLKGGVAMLRYQTAQKLHACTTEPDPGRGNDRSRDLIDLLLLRDLVDDDHDDLGAVRAGCVEVFDLRGRQSWPPKIEVFEQWRVTYPAEAAALKFEITDVDEAAARVQQFADEIDAA